MNVIYHRLYKVDIVTQEVSLQPFAENVTVNNYVLSLLESVSNNEGEREYLFEEGSLTMKTFLDNIMRDTARENTCEQISMRLLQKETAAQQKIEHLDKEIQKGILIISLIQMTATEKKIIISKADYNEFIEEITGNLRSGLPTKKKIFKSFIANISVQGGENSITKLVTYDSNSTKAAYWTKEFLELQEVRNDEKNTKTAYNAIIIDIIEPLRKKHKADYLCLWNATVAYFRGEGEFDLEHYRDNIIGNYLPMDSTLVINDIKTRINRLPDKYKFDSKFTKKPSKVTAKFKNVINLTNEIDLVIKHDVANPRNTFVPYLDEEGKKYLAIQSDIGYLYAQGRQIEANRE